ncbi:MAG TPA: PQQ-binding-like beta-propeller repeat protein [Gemmataceae bacterium]|nr:PQQ-binding-like beta-propeller repeat protein [Gemmataceae bacterium]
MRRSYGALLGLGLIVSLAAWQLLQAQVAIQVAQPVPVGGPVVDSMQVDPNDLGQAITLPTDSKLKQKLVAGRDYISEQDWNNAFTVLQGLLELREDQYVEMTVTAPDGKSRKQWSSVRTEANKLIGSMPPQGLEFYKQTYGGKAKVDLTDAIVKSDPDRLASVMLRYFYTDAGAEATNLLGTYMLDRGQSISAAQCFEKLLKRDGSEKVPPPILFKAYLAFHRAGDKDKENQIWKQLEARAPDGVKLGGQSVALAEMKSLVEQMKDPIMVAGASDWVNFGGDATHSALGKGSTPFTDSGMRKWPMARESTTKNVLYGNTGTIRMLEGMQQAVLPSYFPIAVNLHKDSGDVPVMVYRTFWGVTARDIKSGKLLWEAPSEWSLDSMFKANDMASHLNQWIAQWQQMGRPSSLIENSVIGTLSTDHVRVYLVDDLALAPSFQMMGWGGPWGNQGQPNLTGKIGDALHHSRLQAWNLDTGKIEWTLGGRSNNKKAPNDLDDSFFLGPPLSLGGKLYFLTERNQELRLVCLDPSKIDIRAPEQNLKEAIQWVQTLATTREKMVQDVARRAQAAHLAYGDGVLVCPTNAGAVLGVDLLTHSLVWAYPYREKSPNGMGEGKGGGMMMGGPGMWNGMQPTAGGLLSDWKVTAPIIQDGKVVFAAPDGSAVHCISLREGKFLWEQKKTEKDLYLAGVYDGKVMIVSKDACRALKLSDGTQAWQLQTGMPSGLGVASDNLYYLPLKYAIDSTNKDPEVCVIDMNAGKAIAHTKSHRSATKPAELPGNLLFFEGDVISQNASDIAVFPQLKIKMAQMNELLAKNADDPVGLTERGELNLDSGNLVAAVDDLRKAIKNNPPPDVLPKTKLKLYESLTELLQSDFGKAKEYLNEYEKLCQVDIPTTAKDTERRELEIEGQRRLANRLCLLAKGMEGEQKLTEAFKCYMDFIGVVGNKDQKELISVIDEPLVKASPDVWAQGRISAMVNNKNYSAEARKPLEELIKEKWASVRGKSDLADLRRFVSMFGSLFTVGEAARMELAERLIDEPGTANLLEAELQLHLLQDQQNPELAARAVEATARLMTRKGLLAEAAYYYRLLARSFPNVPVHDGKTGSQLLDDLATDKRFLPYLESSGLAWKASKMRAEMRNQQRNMGQPVYNFETEGELTPFFQQYKVTLNLNFQQVRISDRMTGEDKWTYKLDIGQFNQFVWNWGATNFARFPYQRVGHLIVLNLGQKIYGLDPINKQMLWSKDLAGPNTFPQNGANFYFDPMENVLQILYPTGHRETIGHIGPAEASYVCLVNRDGLTAIDPTNGRTLWNRIGVPARSHVFGDSQHIYVVEMDNGTAGATKVLRAYDGVEVKGIPAFGKLYEKRLAIRGRQLLLSDQSPTGTTIRLYDVQTGKDTWKKDFPAGSVVLRTEDRDLAGAVDPNGKVVVIDLKSKREVLKAQMAPKHIAKVNDIHLLQDGKYFYVACNANLDPNLNPGGGTMSNIGPGTGLRNIGVNGEVYAFNKTSGKVHWHTEVPQQMLLVDQFQELPLLVFTARNQKMIPGAKGAPGMWTNTVAVAAIDKRTGKRVYDRNDMDGNSTQQFTALTSDIKTGKIELATWNLQILFSPVEPETAAAPNKGKTNQSKLDLEQEKRLEIRKQVLEAPIAKDK